MSTLSSLLQTALQTNFYSTTDLPGIGGQYKTVPEDFCVDEVMPYEPCGEGEHVYVRVRRLGMTTPEVAKVLSTAFGYPVRDIGWAGMKDKVAVSTQTFSLRLGWHTDLDEVRDRLTECSGLEILAVDKHQNKIKRGHVKLNHFKIVVRDITPDALSRAELIASELSEVGVPNYFGEQRFGKEFSNIPSACRILEGQQVRGRQDTFMISVLQAGLFNVWLSRRQEVGDFRQIILGDIAQKTDTGGMFDVQDCSAEQSRFDGREIVYTGPVFGYSMRDADAVAGEREQKILQDFSLTPDDFKAVKAAGTRRAAIIYPQDMNVGLEDGGIRLSFALPSGAYATQVLREFIKD